MSAQLFYLWGHKRVHTETHSFESWSCYKKEAIKPTLLPLNVRVCVRGGGLHSFHT